MASPRGQRGATSPFKMRSVFWNVRSGSGVGSGFGKEETKASSPWIKGQRMKRAMDCQSCWRSFPQKRVLARVLNSPQHPVKGQLISRHPGSLSFCLFMGHSPVITPWLFLTSLSSSCWLTPMCRDLSSLKIFFCSVNFFKFQFSIQYYTSF